MTQEDKELLLKDLCARLPYGVMIEVQNELGKLTSIDIDDNDEVIIYSGDCDEDAKIEYCKPYLCPMSSMTEEEKEQTRDLRIGADTKTHATLLIDFYNKHHIDYRGLIEKRLAISTEEFNPYKEEQQ